MTAYIVRRLIATLVVLWGVSILIFVIIQLTPGDFARAQLGSTATAEQVQKLREALGLDEPIVVQYTIWLGNALQGDLGLSFQHKVDAFDLVVDKFKNTLILTGAALALSTFVGLVIGVVAGTRPNSLVDRFATTLGVVAASVPTFWIGIVLLLVFALNLEWLPAVGMYDVRDPGGLPDLGRHLILPTLTVAAVPAAVIARLVRSAVLEIMNLDYIRTARAKGLREGNVIGGHALRNALPGFVAIVAIQAGYLLGGSLVAEVVFSWPGMGSQLYTSVGARDIPVIMSITVLVALAFTLLNLVADVLQGVLDPRVRAGR